MKLAVVVTTYNRPDALAAVLDGYLAQQRHDFELIVADDGSTASTRVLVERIAATAPFPIHHVWQEDDGFRAAAVRNQAVAASEADYIVFTDGDCVPPKYFVEQHRKLAEPGWFVAGNRVLLSEQFTEEVLGKHLAIHRYGRLQWLTARLSGDLNRLLPLVRLPDLAFRKRSSLGWEGVKTCNLAVWRRDLLAVNGLDEAYSGWGLEDSDLVIRLLRAGVRHKSARFAAPVFHLWHRENDRTRLPENQRRLDEVLHSSRIAAREGLDRYLVEVI